VPCHAGEQLEHTPTHVAHIVGTLGEKFISQRGQALGVNFALTRTCYDPSPDGAACGRCDACQLRLKGFREAGFDDPAPYAIRSAGTAS